MATSDSSSDPHNSAFDEVFERIFLDFGSVVAFPTKVMDQDTHWERALSRWKYVYAGYLVLSVHLFWGNLMAGEFIWMFATPIVHIIGGGIAFLAYFGAESASQVDPLIGTTTLTAGMTSVLGFGLITLEMYRRGTNGLGPLPGITLYREDDELLVPFDGSGLFYGGLKKASDEDSVVGRLDRGVSTAVLGETGGGKTHAMRVLLEQISLDDDTAVIVHETGTTLAEELEQQGFEVLRLAPENSDVFWNIFEDIEDDSDFREAADALFGEDEHENDVFNSKAKQVFEGCLRYLVLSAERGTPEGRLGNHQVARLVKQDYEELYATLTEYEESGHLATHLDPGDGRYAGNTPTQVRNQLREVVLRSFTKDFGKEGEFSIRDYLEDPDGRALVLQSTPDQRASTGPMYRLLISWAIRYGMASDTPTQFVLDEVDQLPAIDRLPDLAARGRSEDARLMMGLQTVAQLAHHYEKTGAYSLLGNCPQGIYFGPGEPMTTDYIQGELGERRQQQSNRSVTYTGTGAEKRRASETHSKRTVEREPVESELLKRFDQGDAIVKSRTEWWVGKLMPIESAREMV